MNNSKNMNKKKRLSKFLCEREIEMIKHNFIITYNIYYNIQFYITYFIVFYY